MIYRGDVRPELEPYVRRAVQLATVPGGIDHQSGAGAVANSTPPADATNTISGSNLTVHGFAWDTDAFDDPNSVFIE